MYSLLLIKGQLVSQETPVGVEPTYCCFAGSCLTVWLQRCVRPFVFRLKTERTSLLFFPKSSRRDWNHQKRPDRKQHRLNCLPLPQGHRSLRPSFSSSCLSPWTMRTPRLTLVSDGNPRRRLLIGTSGSKKVFVVEWFGCIAHDWAPSKGQRGTLQIYDSVSRKNLNE